MTRQEALIHLGVAMDADLESIELEDIFDEKVFEIKKYCITHAVVPQLFLKRIAALEVLQSSADALGLDHFETTCKQFTNSIEGETFGEMLSSFNKQLNTLKTHLVSSASVVCVKYYIESLLALHKAFKASFWLPLSAHILPFDSDNVAPHKLSYLMDSMDLYYALKESGLEQMVPDDKSFELIQKKWPTNLPAIKLLLAEYKRVMQLFV